MTKTSGRYRPEIDGLRAIAVIYVILNHAGLPAFAGGFLGVDIFFVISGYLITGNIMRDLHDGRFSLWDFYERRIRRILPALYVVMIFSVAAAWFLMLPDDLENFGQSLVATCLFVNNILLLLTSGYWSLAADFKPLMHTWSLGIEEQYYIAMPLLLWFAFWWGRTRAAFLLTLTICAASLCFGLWASKALPEVDYLLIFSRAWELGFGGLAALCGSKIKSRCDPRSQELLASLGLFFMAAPLVIFNIALPHYLPKLNLVTGVVVIGAVLFVTFAHSASGVGRLLAVKPLVFLGLISYSAYLYHQPIFAFVRITSLAEPAHATLLALVPLIFLLAWLSWRFIEQPFRNRGQVPIRVAGPVLGMTSIILLGAGLAIVASSGFYDWRPELRNDTSFSVKKNIAYNESAFFYSNRPLDKNTRKIKLLVLGNSFARDFINMAVKTGIIDGEELSYSAAAYCLPNALIPLRENIARADFIILGGSGVNGKNLSCVRRVLSMLAKLTRARLYVLGTKNFGWNNNAVMLLPVSIRYAYRAKPLPNITAANDLARSQIDPAIYVDMLGLISDKQGRVPVFTPARKFISEDRSHLTEAGAAYIGPIIFSRSALREISEKVRRVRTAASPSDRHP